MQAEVAAGVAGLLILRLGVAMQASAGARAKNAVSVLLRSLTDMSLGMLAMAGAGTWLLGPQATSGPTLLLAGTASMFIAGTTAERSRWTGLAALPLALGGLVVPLALYWAPALTNRSMGWAWGVVLGMLGGTVAIVAAWTTGPRSDKFNRDGSANAIPGHSLPLSLAGLLLVLVAGMILELSRSGDGSLVLLSVATAWAAGLAISDSRIGKLDAHSAGLSLVSGVFAAIALIGSAPWLAVAAGLLAACTAHRLERWVDRRLRVDDASGIAAAAVAGAASGLLVSILALPTLGQVRWLLWGALTTIAGLVLAAAWGWVCRGREGLVVSDDAEYEGLDLVDHDVSAYPDFQQTMIKSYHLREK